MTNYDPNAPGVNNGRFMGLPFSESEADCILLPVPWDVTTSYTEGTATAPDNILQASYQLDIGNRRQSDSWTKGIYMVAADEQIKRWNTDWCHQAARVIEAWESGEVVLLSDEWKKVSASGNEDARRLNVLVYQLSSGILDCVKILLLIGSVHCSPMEYI